nr:hypothetical protein [Curtobacterium sp. ZW137]
MAAVLGMRIVPGVVVPSHVVPGVVVPSHVVPGVVVPRHVVPGHVVPGRIVPGVVVVGVFAAVDVPGLVRRVLDDRLPVLVVVALVHVTHHTP